MNVNTNTPLETAICFSDYKTEKIRNIKIALENNMCMIVETDEKNAGVNITLKDTITDSVEMNGFIANDNLKSLIKILNIMYRQAITNSTSGGSICGC